MSEGWNIGFPGEDGLRYEAKTPEEQELLRRLTEFSNVMRKDYEVKAIDWWTAKAPGAGSDLEVALYFKGTMADGVFFEASISPIMFAELLADAPLDDFFEHMHRELTLRVDEWKRGMHAPREPDLHEHILAFREWTVNWEHLTIGAIGIGREVRWEGVRWVPAECRAQGRHPKAPFGHAAPHPFCACGFYAWNHFDDTCPAAYGEEVAPDKVWGVVQAKGKIEVHEAGIRAEFMRPVMLAVPEPTQWFVPKDPNDLQLGGTMQDSYVPGAVAVEKPGAENVRKLAKHLGLDAVTWSYVKTKASEYGNPVPQELKPS